MLPFLKPKKASGVVGVVTQKDGESKPEHTNEMLIALGEDLLSAIAMKDASAVADAVAAMVYACDSEPHVEGEHE